MLGNCPAKSRRIGFRLPLPPSVLTLAGAGPRSTDAFQFTGFALLKPLANISVFVLQGASQCRIAEDPVQRIECPRPHAAIDRGEAEEVGIGRLAIGGRRQGR